MNVDQTSSNISKKIGILFKTLMVILCLFSVTSVLGSTQKNTAESNPNFIPQKYRCQVDSDCILSCSEGAINRTSYKSVVNECDDGCSSKGMTAHCIHHLCEAFRSDGRKEKSCTLKEIKK